MADTHEKTAAAAAPARKRGKLLPVLAAVTLLGGGGVAAYWKLWTPASRGAAPAATAKPTVDTGIVSFEPFVVNLADAGGQRFLRVSLRLLASQEEAERMQKSDVTLTRLRSAFVDVLTQQTADAVVTPDGKTVLKKKLLDQAARIVHPAEVSDVLFSDFVVQF